MKKALIAVTVLAAIGLFVLQALKTKPLDTREAIDAQVKHAKTQAELTPEREAMLRIQIAMMDYAATHGSPPNSLEVLVPKYFDSVPSNPRTAQPFVLAELMSPGAGAEAGQVETVSAEVSKMLEKEGFINPNNITLSDFVYDPAGKRDPFEPFDFSGKENIDESLPPLERFSIGQLKVTGIVKDAKSGEYRAFIEDATGIGYPVKIGSRVGNAGGIVVAIQPDKVIVVETRTDFTGASTRSTIEMKLQGQDDANSKYQRIKGTGGAQKK